MHEQREHRRRLAVPEPTEVGEHLGDDARRRDVGDAAEHHRGLRAPAEQQAASTPGVELSTRSTTPPTPAARARRRRAPRRVLEAEREEQQDDADLGRELDEVLGQLRAAMPPSPKTTPATRYAGIGLMPMRSRQPREHREPEDDRAELDERDRDVVGTPRRGSGRGQLARERAVSASRPSGVPMATTSTPGASTSSAPGAAVTLSPSSSATTDTPVLVWIAASAASGRPIRCGRDRIQSSVSPATSCCTAARCSAMRDAPSNSARVGASSGPA